MSVEREGRLSLENTDQGGLVLRQRRWLGVPVFEGRGLRLGLVLVLGAQRSLVQLRRLAGPVSLTGNSGEHPLLLWPLLYACPSSILFIELSHLWCRFILQRLRARTFLLNGCVASLELDVHRAMLMFCRTCKVSMIVFWAEDVKAVPINLASILIVWIVDH